MYRINPKVILPEVCYLIGTDWFKKCHECPLGYNRSFTCKELLETNLTDIIYKALNKKGV